MTNEIDKSLLTKSASIAAEKPKSELTTKSVLQASPMETLQILRAEK